MNVRVCDSEVTSRGGWFSLSCCQVSFSSLSQSQSHLFLSFISFLLHFCRNVISVSHRYLCVSFLSQCQSHLVHEALDECYSEVKYKSMLVLSQLLSQCVSSLSESLSHLFLSFISISAPFSSLSQCQSGFCLSVSPIFLWQSHFIVLSASQCWTRCQSHFLSLPVTSVSQCQLGFCLSANLVSLGKFHMSHFCLSGVLILSQCHCQLYLSSSPIFLGQSDLVLMSV